MDLRALHSTKNSSNTQEKKLIGCFPLYPPVELLSSMGFTPVVLWNLKKYIRGLADSDRHVQNYSCGIARELVQFAISRGGGELDGIFFYNACDTLRNIPEILTAAWRKQGRDIPMFRMHVPQVDRMLCDPGRYLENEVSSLVSSLESTFDISFSPEKFYQATKYYSRMRGLCVEAEEFVARGEISFGAFCDVVLSGYHMPVEMQIETLEALIAQKTTSRQVGAEKRVVLSGIMPPPSTVIDAMESAGLRVAGNDIASLRRSYAFSPEPTESPEAYYRDMFTRRFPCSTLLYTADARVETLMEMTTRAGADGLVFVGEKFCEHEYFEFPYIEKRMKEKGLSVMTLEFCVDDVEHAGSHVTRVEAFSELLY